MIKRNDQTNLLPKTPSQALTFLSPNPGTRPIHTRPTHSLSFSNNSLSSSLTIHPGFGNAVPFFRDEGRAPQCHFTSQTLVCHMLSRDCVARSSMEERISESGRERVRICWRISVGRARKGCSFFILFFIFMWDDLRE